MEKIIEIDLFNINDLLEKYNKTKISKELMNYIISSTPEFNKKDKIKIIVNSTLNNDIPCEEIIRDGIKNEFYKNYQKHRRTSTLQFIYLIVGMITLFVSTLIEIAVFREVVLICAWVLIWAMVELEIFSDMDERKERRILKKLLDSEIIINRHDK